MKAKLQHLIKSEGLTASRFAEMLEIQPAGVSHILAGRNKPSFDLLQKILRRFPKINPDWLLLDSEQMYREGWNEVDSSNDGSAPNNSGNSGMPTDSLFGSAGIYEGANISGNSGSANFSGGANSSRMPIGGSNFSGDSGALGGVNGRQPHGGQNLSRGEANISAGQSMGAGLSHSRAGSPIHKIVIFYADGTFEAYFPR